MAAAIGSRATSLRLAIVGDVHDDWDTEIDSRALECLKPDLVLFTGDFGDENVPLVEEITRLTLPKVAILGNHDCWWTAGFAGEERPSTNANHGDAVQAQLDLLGKDHVGYSRADFSNLGLSVVGGRPGSGGGANTEYTFSIARQKWNVWDAKQSSERIIAQALEAPVDHSLVFLNHNGPTGLGSNCSDICGRDWVLEGGDHGDPDLAMALAHVKRLGKRKVPLVVFGHMHKNLYYDQGCRKMIVVGEDGTIYLNAAVVPRIRYSKIFNPLPSERNFTVVDMVDGEPKKIVEVWVKVTEYDACVGEQTVLYLDN